MYLYERYHHHDSCKYDNIFNIKTISVDRSVFCRTNIPGISSIYILYTYDVTYYHV